MSLGVNTLVTSLIVYRIMTIYNDIQGLDASVQARTHGKKLVSILIESGLITFVGQLTQSIMYKSEQAAFPLVRGCVVMLYVRASCWFLIWCFNFVYLLNREFRRQLSLCVSKCTIIIHHQRQRIQWNWNTQYRRPLKSHPSDSYALDTKLILVHFNFSFGPNAVLQTSTVTWTFLIHAFLAYSLLLFQGVEILSHHERKTLQVCLCMGLFRRRVYIVLIKKKVKGRDFVRFTVVVIPDVGRRSA